MNCDKSAEGRSEVTNHLPSGISHTKMPLQRSERKQEMIREMMVQFMGTDGVRLAV